jgi:hypothetical protein
METIVEVYEAGPPLEGKWVLMWRTARMPTPAFWYFDTREEAEAEAKRLRDGEE